MSCDVTGVPTHDYRGRFWAYSERARIWEKRFGIEWPADDREHSWVRHLISVGVTAEFSLLALPRDGSRRTVCNQYD